MVEIVKVTKIYPPDVVALRNVSLSAAKGELIFLTGPSGAGKTTLLKLLCRQEIPTKGLIEVDGNDLTTLSDNAIQNLRQRIGVAYQDFKLLPRLSVFQNIAMPMEVQFRSPRDIRNRVTELMEKLGIREKQHKPAGKLSRGEQQRVAIARAAANSPLLLLADEPTGNLDAATTGLVMALFQELNENGSTIIIATHDESIYQGTNHRKFELQQGELF
ncbi:MAG: cell division ATP-binding protein FtsE [Proteobacteria bacterium]|nr:cell division ATP-binding protein FtsE [Pseudomonadota bacterium]MBU0965755.1 cell division ATP-binding protein FtsE [Pseudomonadota bacterium]